MVNRKSDDNSKRLIVLTGLHQKKVSKQEVSLSLTLWNSLGQSNLLVYYETDRFFTPPSHCNLHKRKNTNE